MKKGEEAHWLYKQPWILRWGVSSWMLLAITGMIVVVGMAYDKAHSVILPLAIAAIIGILLRPLVELMVRHRIPRWLATAITMFIIIAMVSGIVTLIIYGIATQAGAIERQASDGVDAIKDWFNNLEIKDSIRQWITDKIDEVWPEVQDAVTERVTGTVPGIASFLLGTFIGLFMLIFILGDDGTIDRWVAGHLGVPRDRGEAILKEVTASVRGYFKGTTIIATVNALLIIPVAIGLGVPMVAPISVVTFVTCYIPSFGGYIGGAFAVIITVAAQGLTRGIIMLVFVIISHTILQGPVQAYAYGKTLKMHPLVALLVTLLGAVLGGIAGAILAVPLTAVAIKVSVLLKYAREVDMLEDEEEAEPPEELSGGTSSP